MSGMIDPQIFDHLKAKIDEDTQARDELTQIVQKLERDVSYTQGLLSRIHSTPRSACEFFSSFQVSGGHVLTYFIDSPLLQQVEASIKLELEDTESLSTAASKHPYYK